MEEFEELVYVDDYHVRGYWRRRPERKTPEHQRLGPFDIPKGPFKIPKEIFKVPKGIFDIRR